MNPDTLKVYVKTLGCKVNQVESESLLSELSHYNVELAEDMSAAQVVVINTCSVTSEADAKTRKAIRKCARQEGVVLAIPTGCSAALHEDELNLLEENVCVVADKTSVARFIIDRFSLTKKEQVDSLKTMREDHPALFRSRSFVKVQDGCDNFCSYCIVPYARGDVSSTPYADVREHVEELAANGVKEIVLTGINVGRYYDETAGINTLAELIRRLALSSIERIRVSSIEPVHVDESFIDLFSTEPKLCEHLHIPLQSGSNLILSAMNRAYTREEFASMVAQLKNAVPHIALTTDVIVGFPGEADEDFAETLELCERCGFAKIHVFRYSQRSGTPAAEMQQIEPEVVAERALRLRELGEKLASEYRRAQKGRELEVLIEREQNHQLTATSREHIVMTFPSSQPDLEGHLMKVGNIYKVLG